MNSLSFVDLELTRELEASLKKQNLIVECLRSEKIIFQKQHCQYF